MLVDIASGFSGSGFAPRFDLDNTQVSEQLLGRKGIASIGRQLREVVVIDNEALDVRAELAKGYKVFIAGSATPEVATVIDGWHYNYTHVPLVEIYEGADGSLEVEDKSIAEDNGDYYSDRRFGKISLQGQVIKVDDVLPQVGVHEESQHISILLLGSVIQSEVQQSDMVQAPIINAVDQSTRGLVDIHDDLETTVKSRRSAMGWRTPEHLGFYK